MNKLHILILDDAKEFCDELGEFLTDLGHEVYQATLPSEATVILEQQQIDIALVDLMLPEKDGMDILREIKQQYPYTEVIIITGHGKMDRVIEAMRAGAVDFIAKPFGLTELQHAIERTQKFRNLEDQLNIAELNYKLIAAELKEGIGSEIVGVSPAMKKVIHLAARVAKFDNTSVLITGESGTGKELIAKGIHAMSNRNDKYFHSVNCSAIPESLFESEFFGHNKGSFTGAVENTRKWFEISHHGTLFLDEVAELPLSVQAKFLRVLDDKVISKIGAKKEISLDVRIIAATNQKLNDMVETGSFRIDLFHRLNSFVIHIPPLRERREDIPELINYYVRHFSKRLDKEIRDVDKCVYKKLGKYDFPGNVRELKNMIEQAMIICDDPVLKLSHFRQADNKTRENGSPPTGHDYDLEKIEKKVIVQALQSVDNNKTKAAEMLKITRQALDRKIKKHEISNGLKH